MIKKRKNNNEDVGRRILNTAGRKLNQQNYYGNQYGGVLVSFPVAVIKPPNKYNLGRAVLELIIPCYSPSHWEVTAAEA